jgi:hypothetical protein
MFEVDSADPEARTTIGASENLFYVKIAQTTYMPYSYLYMVKISNV